MHPTDGRWKFSIAVLLPVALAVLVTVALAAAFILWSAQRTDQASLSRQHAVVAHFVQGARSDFERTQRAVVLRYEVTEAFLYDEPDFAWIEPEMGWGEYIDFSHDRVYVLDPDLRPIFAAREGETVDLSAYHDDSAAIAPLAGHFRKPEMIAAIQSYEAGDADQPPQRSDFVTIGGRIAVASILPITSNWDEQEQEPGGHFYHAAIQFLDNGFADTMMADYLLAGAHFDAIPNTLPHETMVPVANQSGRFVAYFKWQPERPGQALLADTLPASVGLLGAVGLIIALLLFRLARSTAALDKARADALYRATHDPLTGLGNRALFNDRLEHAPLPLALLALDLDRFKQVNDTLGHEAGDELLRQVAARLRGVMRATDLIARLGGDEFMVLIAGAIDHETLVGFASRIVGVIAEPFTLGGETASIGISVGVATATGQDRGDVVARADYALYEAKESGRNTYRVFSEARKAA